MKDDFDLYLTNKNCKLYKDLVDYIKSTNHEEYINEFIKFVVQKYLKTLGVGLREGIKTMIPKDETNYDNYTDEELLNKFGVKLCSYVYWSK